MTGLWLFFVFIITCVGAADGQSVSASLNKGPYVNQRVLFARTGDTISLKFTETVQIEHEQLYWVKVVQGKNKYDNTVLKNRYASTELHYQIIPLRRATAFSKLTIFADTIGPGTSYWAVLTLKTGDIVSYQSAMPLTTEFSGRGVQIVCRKDDSYSGYLGELFNTPFILTPRLIPSLGHQTDLRMGSDCAEFLIYGKRRQGFAIPYCGPKRLIQYLDRVMTDTIFAGCIIHFGVQTALLYEDRGIIGRLDDEDILLQCYERGPEKIALKDSEFRRYPCKVFVWKQEYMFGEELK